MKFTKYQNRGAYHYDWYRDNTFNYKDCVDRCVEFCKGSTLDVGCGEGLIVKKLLDKGIDAIGIDNEIEAISLANIPEVRLYDVTQPIKGKWDYMACLNVIEHLQDPMAIKRIFNRNITKAAIIITDLPQGELPPEHVHEFTPYELKQMFHTRKVIPFRIGENFHGIEVYK